MSKITIHAPKTPVTSKSKGVAAATIPNVCKVPAPPAPFVPTPLPNIAKSNMSPKGFSRKVKFEGAKIAIRGGTFKSMGDIASKSAGGGLVSANTHGPAKFIMPGSPTVKAEGKPVHLLGEPMLNNLGPSGSPPNTGAAMMGLIQPPGGPVSPLVIKCEDAPAKKGSKKFTKCEKEEICVKCDDVNQQAKEGKLKRVTGMAYEINRADGDYKCSQLNKKARDGERDLIPFSPTKTDECAKELKQQAEDTNYESVSADHVHEIQLGGHPGHPTSSDNLRWMSRRPNSWIGTTLKQYDPDKHDGVKPDCCD